MTVHDQFLPLVDDLHEGEVFLLPLAHWDVDLLVVLNPLQEVRQGRFPVHIQIVRAVNLHHVIIYLIKIICFIYIISL